MRSWGDHICVGEQKDFDNAKCPLKPTQILALRSPAFVQGENGDSWKLCEMKKMCRNIRRLDTTTVHCDVSFPLWSYRAFLSQTRVSYCLADGCAVLRAEQMDRAPALCVPCSHSLPASGVIHRRCPPPAPALDVLKRRREKTWIWLQPAEVQKDLMCLCPFKAGMAVICCEEILFRF